MYGWRAVSPAGDITPAYIRPFMRPPRALGRFRLGAEPRQIIRGAGGDGQPDDFGRFVGMARAEEGFDFGIKRGRRLDQQQDFRLLSEYLRQKGIYPQIRFELQGIDDIARLVEEGLGISLLPDWSARDLHAAQTLRRWPLPKPCPSRILGMVSLKSGARSKLVASFAEMAKKLHSA